MSVNLAPDATVSGSISGSPYSTDGALANVNDEDDATYYGFSDNQFINSLTVEVKLDLGESKSITNIDFLHFGAVGFIGPGDTMDVNWDVSYSTDDVSYTSYMSGTYNLTSVDSFDATESQISDINARYIKITTTCDTFLVSSPNVAAFYRVKEIYIYGVGLLDIGMRIHDISIGAKIATNDEPLRIFVNGEVYGIPWQADSPAKIYAGGSVRGLSTI